MKILLVCAAGMSTSLLVSNMRKFAEKEGIIEAKSVSELEKVVEHYDVVLVGPQIRHEFEKIQTVCQEHGKMAGLIDMVSYGRMDGKAALEQAKDLMKNNKKGEGLMKKLKITLACAGGMSTSMLCKKIIAASEKRGYEGTECNAFPVAGLVKAAPGSDVILLGPQVNYQLNTVKKLYPDIPVEVINMSDYGMMNGEKIFNDLALKFGW